MSDSLQIGIVSEGNPDEPTNQLLRRIQVAAQKASQRHPNLETVQFIIQVSGSIYKPKFEGVRLGGYSRADKRLNVFIGVPERLDQLLQDYLMGALEEGERLAQRYFERNKLSESAEPLAAATKEVLQELRHGPE